MNGTPELVVYGHGVADGPTYDDEIADFYTIDEDRDAISCLGVSEENKFTIELLHDIEEDTYGWYQVAGNDIIAFSIVYAKADGFVGESYKISNDGYAIGDQLERVNHEENVKKGISLEKSTNYESILEEVAEEYYTPVEEILPKKYKTANYSNDLSVK